MILGPCPCQGCGTLVYWYRGHWCVPSPFKGKWRWHLCGAGATIWERDVLGRRRRAAA